MLKAIDHTSAADFARTCFSEGVTNLRAAAELERVPAAVSDYNKLLTAAVEGGHPMHRDLTSRIIPLKPPANIETVAAAWEPLPGHSRIRCSPDGQLLLKEGLLTELSAQAGALARLQHHLGVSIPKLVLHADCAGLSEDDCYRYNLEESDNLMGVESAPRAYLLMERIPAGPLRDFLKARESHDNLQHALTRLEAKMRTFLLGLGYIPDYFRLSNFEGSQANISLRPGALEHQSFHPEDVVLIDPAIGYADLTGFGKTVAELLPSTPGRHLPSIWGETN